MLISRKEKEKLVIKLTEEGKTTREVAKAVRISLKDIGKIIHKATGDDDNEITEKETEKEKQKWLKVLSPYARAFQMFKDIKSLADVAIELDIKTDMVLNYHDDYLRLVNMNGLVKIYNEFKNDFPLLFHLYRRIKKEQLSKQNINNLVKNQQELVFLEKRVELYHDRIRGQQSQILELERI